MAQTRQGDSSRRVSRPARVDPRRAIAAGVLTRPLSAKLILEGEMLELRYQGGKTVTPPPRLLEEFAAIADAPESAQARTVLRFARRYGGLDLCRDHKLPASHNPGLLGFTFTQVQACRRRGSEQRAFDLVTPWVQFSRQARAALRIVSRLNMRQYGDEKDWAVMPEGTRLIAVELRPRSVEHDWTALLGFVNAWLAIGQAAAYLDRPGGRLVMRFGTVYPEGRLFATIGLQLARRILQAQRMAICSRCGMDYRPRRAVSAKLSNYCPSCVPRGQYRRSKKYRDAVLQARRMDEQGIPVHEIAGRLGRSPDLVRGWKDRRWTR